MTKNSSPTSNSVFMQHWVTESECNNEEFLKKTLPIAKKN